jgi:hypothetical protein
LFQPAHDDRSPPRKRFPAVNISCSAVNKRFRAVNNPRWALRNACSALRDLFWALKKGFQALRNSFSWRLLTVLTPAPAGARYFFEFFVAGGEVAPVVRR